MKKLMKVLVMIGILIELALAIVTVYTMGYEQGSGLYVATKWGLGNRHLNDVIITGCVAAVFLLLLSIPCILTKHKNATSLFRLLSVYLAIMPVTNMGTVVSVWGGQNLFQVKFDFEYALAIFASYIKVVVPLIIMLYFLYKCSGLTMKRWHKVCIAMQFPFFAGLALLPQLSEIMWFWGFYILIVLAFDWWEKLCEKEHSTGVKVLTWLVFIFMCLKGCSRLLEMLVRYWTYG